MSNYEYLRAEPYISVSTESANRILQEFEIELRLIGHKIEDAFYNIKFASDCEHQAWLLWLKANMSYHYVGYHLRGYKIQDRQRINVEKNRNLMDEYFYLKLRNRANSLKYTNITSYQKFSDKMQTYIDACGELIVVAHAIRRGIRRFSSSDGYDLSEYPAVHFRMSNGKIGVCIGEVKEDREGGLI